MPDPLTVATGAGLALGGAGQIIGSAIPSKFEKRRKKRIKELDERSEMLKENLDGLWLEIPNLPHETVPAGDAEQTVAAEHPVVHHGQAHTPQ